MKDDEEEEKEKKSWFSYDNVTPSMMMILKMNEKKKNFLNEIEIYTNKLTKND